LSGYETLEELLDNKGVVSKRAETILEYQNNARRYIQMFVN
jgi:hypothetical protein